MQRSFRSDRRGVIAIMVALMMVPLLAVVGLAIDYGFWTRAQVEVDIAADSAALIAVTTAANAYAAGDTNWQAEAQASASSFFSSQITDLSYVTAANNQLSVKQDPNSNNVFNASLSFTGSMPTYFARALGYPSFSVNGGSAATTTATSYVDIHIVMDNSSSMLIGATQADMENLAKYVQQYSSWDSYNSEGQSQSCSFGCHFSNTMATRAGPNGNSMSVPQDFYGVALLTGVTLRLNVVTSAVANVITSMQQKQPPNNILYQVALYSFNNPSQTNQNGRVDSPTTLYPLGSNFTTAAQTASSLQVPMTVDGTYEPDTDIGNVLTYVLNQVPTTNGTGTASNHKAFVFLITDGVYDFLDSGNSRHMGALSPSTCQALKDANVQIYVLYTQYVPLTAAQFSDVPNANNNSSSSTFQNSFYASNIQAYAGNGTQAPSSTTLYQNLQSCASSPSAFFPASSTSDINSQMQAMLNAALGSPGRFTR